jgi:hypothetical protein
MRMPEHPETSTPASLWAALRHYLETAFALFGGPECIAALGFLSPRLRRDMLSWLRPLEQALRALIYAEALAAPQPPAPASKPREHVKRTRRWIESDPDRPEEWRVRFALLAPAPRASSGAARGKSALISAWPVAERFESLIRAFNNPAPLVRRMARLIARAASRVAKQLRFKPRAQRGPCDWLLEAVAPRTTRVADTSGTLR